MQDTVRAYTRDLVAAFAAQGTPVDISQNGNEITYGFLVPVGAIYGGPTGLNWPDFTSLVNAGVVGAKQGAGTRGIQIMIHIHPGDSASWTRWWFDNFVQYDVPFDIIGVSYYPFMAGGLSSLLYNVSSNSARYTKPVLVAEVSYPWTLADGDSKPNIIAPTPVLPDGALYPPTLRARRRSTRR